MNKSGTREFGQEITEVPEDILQLLSTPSQSLVVTSEKDFEKLIKDYLIHNLQKTSTEFSYEIVKGMNYLSTLLFEIMKIRTPSEIEKTIANPYYNYWASKDDYKKAGDASVYNYLFRKSGKGIMSPQDHLQFTINGYYHFFEEKIIAQGIGAILRQIQGINSENNLFKR